MERIVKLFSLAVFSIFLMLPAFSEEVQQQSIYGTPQKVTLSQCVKTFNIGFEKLFFLTEASISRNNFEIQEIQTQGGYIVYSAGSYKFLSSVLTFGHNKAILKITPCNNNYTFPPLIVNNVFKYIESNQYKKF